MDIHVHIIKEGNLILNELSFIDQYNDTELQITTGDKILGVNIDENLTWSNHYQFVCRKNVFLHLAFVQNWSFPK